MSVAIKVENISKQYQLGKIGTGTLSKDLKRWYSKILGKEDPFLKIGDLNVRDAKGGNSDLVWALKDINFEIEKGDAVGIIGRNGAGKSTLLKILSRVTSPTTGNIFAKGRIASLLEVGTGFHPELTGRENIFLNGSILGMKRNEILNKFDEIVEFSGVERYIDTPVKRYSSGMYVRLAFAVAAHLDSEILIVDEVLAVGDAEFQKKCLGKMTEVSKGEGRTVLFVSHNLTAVSSLCNQAIYLKNGLFVSKGNVEKIITEYIGHGTKVGNHEWQGINGNDIIRLTSTKIFSSDLVNGFHTNADLHIEISGELFKPIVGLILGFTLWSQFEHELAYTLYDDNLPPPANIVSPGVFKYVFKIPKNSLAEGHYKIKFDVGIHLVKKIANEDSDLNFSLLNISGNGRRYIINEEIRGRSSLFRPSWIIN